jgi:cold shock CspA family protein
VATGVVVRFDSRRGYGFLAPDEGGEDVFVHQNNINMEGFRFLQVGERVSYELEVGEKGMKAVSVALLEPRQAKPSRQSENGEDRPRSRNGEGRQRRDDRAEGGDLAQTVERLKRRQDRLIAVLIEKGLLAPGEIDADIQASADSAL